ncbi:hypothetical protein IE077_001960 [Cardiosporidium cionae]|uniref:Kinase n=1 Tax=Cardiosporidium cionae TaxID=476202 RepID=A0ABQ7JBV8_9APIC|nr:hypothetical protein IE077_001960 [Cardiosporidium cionae]|eukprot:KAF8821498.1 hypothetical protein IE077_001960 [Cardiosporidium cionae]
MFRVAVDPPVFPFYCRFMLRPRVAMETERCSLVSNRNFAEMHEKNDYNPNIFSKSCQEKPILTQNAHDILDWLCRLYSNLVQCPLEEAKTITGTSLMLRDANGYLYKHIPESNTREFKFYFGVFLSFISTEAFSVIKRIHLRTEHQCTAGTDYSEGSSQISDANPYLIPQNTPDNKFTDLLEEPAGKVGSFWDIGNYYEKLRKNATLNREHAGKCLSKTNGGYNAILSENSNLQEGKASSSLHYRKGITAHLTEQFSSLPQLENFFLKCIQCLKELHPEHKCENLDCYVAALSYLRQFDFIPDFYGRCSASQEKQISGHKSDWNLIHNDHDSNGVKLLQMANLFHTYDRPAILDVKLGSGYLGQHPCEPGFVERQQYSGVSLEDRYEITKQWRICKKNMRKKLNFMDSCAAVEKIGPADLGSSKEFASMQPPEFQRLLKSWRQEEVSGKTTQKILGFRICGFNFTDEFGQKQRLATHQGMEISAEDAEMWIRRFFRGSRLVAQGIFSKVLLLRQWLANQRYFHFYATSIAIGYDEVFPPKFDARWLDFAHSIPRSSQRAFPPMSDLSNQAADVNKSILLGLDNLITIFKKIMWDAPLRCLDSSCSYGSHSLLTNKPAYKKEDDMQAQKTNI